MMVNRPIPRGFVLVLVLVASSCSSGGPKASSPTTVGGHQLGVAATTVPRGVRTRLELPARSVVSGDSVDGDLVVDNETGQPIHSPICGAWDVELTNGHVPVQRIFFFKCAPGPTFPVGVHRYPFTVDTRYRCGPRPSRGVACDGDVAPRLPPAEYHAVFVQAAMHLPVPAPVTVRVVARPRTTGS